MARPGKIHLTRNDNSNIYDKSLLNRKDYTHDTQPSGFLTAMLIAFSHAISGFAAEPKSERQR